MGSYVYLTKMDEDIEKLVKAYKSCALAAKLPTTKLEPWPKTDTP